MSPNLPIAATLVALSFGFTATAGAQVTLVAHDDTWRYHKGTVAAQVDWTTAADAALGASWLNGPGGFGYADGDDGTTLGDMQDGYLTVYTRREFQVTAGMDPADSLRLTVDYDDGCIIYLDGNEVYRSSNVPGAADTPHPHDTDLITVGHEASAGAGGNPPEVIDLGPLGALLAPGTHVLAAHGINAALDSSDLSLIVDLDLIEPPADVTWTAADSPVSLDTDLSVSGVTLTIEAGVEVLLGDGVSIRATAGGDIDVTGTAADPVVLRSAGGGDWGQLSTAGAGGSLTIRHAKLSGGTVRVTDGATGLIEDATISDASASAIISSNQASSMTLRRCRVADYNETLFQLGLITIEHCLFERSNADSVDFDGASPGSTIRQCTFRGGAGGNTDAIDIGPTGGIPSTDVLIADCVMHDFGDKGVSIGDGPTDATGITVRNCLIYNVDVGVQVKHAGETAVEDCTISGATFGLHGFEKAGGTGGGIFTSACNNILSGNTTPIETEIDTVIDVEYSNTHGADWPGIGNLNSDPLFTNPAAGDFSLLPGSPCIGTGKLGDNMGAEFPIGGLLGNPPRLGSIASAPAGGIELRFAALATVAYRVEYSDTLEENSWQLLQDVAADSAPRTAVAVSDDPPEGTDRRFYRLTAPGS